MKSLVTQSVGLFLVVLGSLGANAEEKIAFANDTVQIRGGIGILALQGNDYVYNDTGSRDVLAKFIWESISPMLTGALDVKFPEGWTLGGEAQIGLSGNSYMQDYDWLNGSFGANDWTHRSQHDDTNLDWYFNGSLRLGHEFTMDQAVTVNLNAGFKYVDVQWAAFGGSYLYSVNGLRDMSGDIPPGTPFVSYRQQLPAVFLGVDTQIVQDAWTFDLGAKAGVAINSTGVAGQRYTVAIDNAGVTFNSTNVDNMVFSDFFTISPMVAIAAKAEYRVADNLNVFVSGTFDKVFLSRGNTSISAVENRFFADAAGADLMAASLSVGLKGKF